MPLFRKKPVVVEAIQWSGFNYRDIQKLALKHDYVKYHYTDHYTLELWNDLEGCWVRCPQYHWVIKGIKGEVYPCETEAFEQTYEPVTDSEIV